MSDKIKKTGRPSKAIKREKVVSVHLFQNEYENISAKAQLVKQSLSVYMRICALSNSVQYTITEEDRIIIRKLIGMSVNINELVKIARNQNLLTLMQELINQRNEINSIIKKINP